MFDSRKIDLHSCHNETVRETLELFKLFPINRKTRMHCIFLLYVLGVYVLKVFKLCVFIHITPPCGYYLLQCL